MVAAYATPDVTAVVTWNPLLSEIAADAGRRPRCSIRPPDPRRDHRHDDGQHRDAEGQSRLRQGAGRRLVRDDGADVDGTTRPATPRATAMAEASGTDLAGFDAQLATTQMFYEPAEAVAFTNDAEAAQTRWSSSRKFLFDHGLLGQGATSAGRRRHRVPRRQDARRHRQRQAALRPDLHGDGGRREALTAQLRCSLLAAQCGPGTGRSGADAERRAPRPMLCAMAREARRSQQHRIADAPDQSAAEPRQSLVPRRAAVHRCSSSPMPIGSHIRLAGQSRRQAAAVARADGGGVLAAWPSRPTSAPATTCSGPTPPPASPGCSAGIAIAALIALGLGIADRLPPARAGDARAVRRRDLADPADRRAADPVHRLRPRRDLEGDADRRRHRAGHGARRSPRR